MRTSRLFSVLTASVVLVSGTAVLSPAYAQTQAPAGKPEISYERTDLDINQVLVKLMAAGYNKVDKIERERDAYEVRALDKSGARVKLYVDPQTGDPIKSGRQGARQDQRATEAAPA